MTLIHCFSGKVGSIPERKNNYFFKKDEVSSEFMPFTFSGDSNAVDLNFPIIIIVMMVLLYAGRYLQMSSMENIIGKTRYEMSPIEYRRSAREIKMAIRNGKLDNVGKFKSTALESPEKVNGINSDENSPFSKK